MSANTKPHKLSLLAFAALLAYPAVQAADVVVQPSAGSGLVVKDSLGSTERWRVQESGQVSIPGWQTLPVQTAQVCINFMAGIFGPCAPTVGFAVPYAATVSNAATLFDITQSGSGGTVRAAISDTGNSNTVMTVSTSGVGGGVDVQLPGTSGARAINVNHAGVGPGVFVQTQGGNSLWGIVTSISAAAVIGDSASGEAVVGRQTGAVCGQNIGKCHGIGAVVGRHDGEGGYGVRGFVTDPNGAIGVIGQVGISGGTGVAGRFENVNAANGGNTLEVASNGNGNLAVFYKGGNVARIDSTGKGFFNGGTQTGGADVAELINTKGRLPQPGDVVEIDPENAMHYRLSSGAESSLVAGVITTKPGVLMNAGVEDVAGIPALALVGRVPVKVTLEGGAIKPGDLLVSATLPGHAKRAPASVAPGTVIGKALQAYANGETGSVEMLVMTR
ncbi:MAG: hypothetical protein WBC18_09865 [Ottowia sp.]|uniref:hypothetical protein n=1 Tax=unclassified Ottowia TaxID=2645081 RepID=UPI003C3013AA